MKETEKLTIALTSLHHLLRVTKGRARVAIKKTLAILEAEEPNEPKAPRKRTAGDIAQES